MVNKQQMQVNERPGKANTKGKDLPIFIPLIEHEKSFDQGKVDTLYMGHQYFLCNNFWP